MIGHAGRTSRPILAALVLLGLAAPVHAQSGTDLFNPAALLIVFREILEASIIISVLLNALTKVGAEDKRRYVWIGAGCGLVVSLILAVAFVATFYAASTNAFSGSSRMIFQGVLSAVAAVMVTLVGFNMLKFSGLEAKWEAKLRSRGAKVLEGGGAPETVELSEEEKEEMTGSKTKIFLVIFTTVVREGVETAVFIGGVGASNWRSLPLPALVGVVLGVAVGWFVLRGGKQVKSIKWFFYASCVFLLFVAAGFTNYAASEIEGLYTREAQLNGDTIVGVPLWDLSACCNENTNGFFTIFRAILGYRDKPTLIVALVYLGYWVVVILMAWRKFAMGSLWTSKAVLAQEKEQRGAPAAEADSDGGRESVGKHMAPSHSSSGPGQGPLRPNAPPPPPSFSVDAYGTPKMAMGSPHLVPPPRSIPGPRRWDPIHSETHSSGYATPHMFPTHPPHPPSSVYAHGANFGFPPPPPPGGHALGVPTNSDDKLIVAHAVHSDFDRASSDEGGGAGGERLSRRAHALFAAALALILILIIAVSSVAGVRAARTRVHFIAAEEMEWDYAPSGVNGATGVPFTDPSEAHAALYTVRTDKFLGRKLKKVRYVEYTDGSFSVRKPTPPEWEHAGIVGPVIRCEVGDSVRVIFRNNDAERPYSINVRGLQYTKDNEGVRYDEAPPPPLEAELQSSGAGRRLLQEDAGLILNQEGVGPSQADDLVFPGETFAYNWNVPDAAGPADGDASSVAWTYQSAANGEFDLFTGLIGLVIVHARGATGGGGLPHDVDREVVAFFLNFNEDESHKRDANIAELTPECTDECHFGDEEVWESQQKRSINGYLYDNVPAMVMGVGERVRWYVVSMGNEADLHAVHWHEQTVVHREHRKQTLEMMAGSLMTVDMIPDQEGKHSVECMVNEHYASGMLASYTVLPADGETAAAGGGGAAGTTRSYFIAVEEGLWDYAPTGKDTVTFLMPGMSEFEAAGAASGAYLARSRYTKARYIEYTDASFTTRAPVESEWEHKGILGPTLRAAVGDEVVVMLKNSASKAVSFVPFGLKLEEGHGSPGGVAPGSTHTYRFSVPERAGPGAGDGSSLAWMYVSDVRQSADVNAGLVGATIVTRREDGGRPADVDKEFLALFSIFDENDSWLGGGGGGGGADTNRKYCINGFTYGNNDKFKMAQGERVRWHLLSLGDQVGLHTAHFHAQTVQSYAMRTDVIELLPASAITVDMVPDSVGTWLLHCHVSLHMHNGMIATYTVTKAAGYEVEKVGGGGHVREYFVACEEVVWDFGPSGVGGLTGLPFRGTAPATYMERNGTRVGSAGIKARYIEYTDGTFTERAEIAPEWVHKGVLGPVLRGEVGDEIHVTFLNRCTRPYSMHPHGVEYKKASEGAVYNDGSAPANRAMPMGVVPGAKHVYEWNVVERAGPAEGDGSSVPWLYHSHVNEGRDVTSGLIGLIIISRKGAGGGGGAGEKVGRPYDVDKELVLFMKVFDEQESWYMDENIERYTNGMKAITKRCTEDGEQPDADGGCESFAESNMKHAMNGYMFDNNPYMNVRAGDRVRWYLLNLGSEVDMHGIIWNGNNVVMRGVRKDQVALMPASMLTADMVPRERGRWLVKCQVTDHTLAGMISTYTVE